MKKILIISAVVSIVIAGCTSIKKGVKNPTEYSNANFTINNK